MQGTLVLCGTPIGNLQDASPRLAAILRDADTVYAEDTRRSRKLLDHLGVSRRLRSYFAGNEAARSAELAERLAAGETVALVTDAGMPGISDPGVSAVRAARQVGATVTVVPGPSAVTSALAVSGFASDRFVFEGFLPRRGRSRRLATLAEEARTMVLFLSPHRASSDLAALGDVFGSEREVCVARELTKLHEEIWWGTLGEALDRFGGEVRGEVTLVVAGRAESLPDLDIAVAEVEQRIAAGELLAGAVRDVAETMGLGRKQLYEAALKRRESSR